MRCVVDYYVKFCFTVNLCALDITKAFAMRAGQPGTQPLPAFNAIYGKVGKLASVDVVIELFERR